MTARKQGKKIERAERLRVHNSKRRPRRPYEPHRPRSTGRDPPSESLIELGHALERENEEGRHLLEWDYATLLRSKDSVASEAGIQCHEHDGSLISAEGLQARHPGSVQIILPPEDGDGGSEAEAACESPQPLAPIVEYSIAGAPGWRLAFVPRSRIKLTPLRALLDEADDAD